MSSSDSLTGSIKTEASGSVGFDRPGAATVSDKLSDHQEAEIERLRARTEEAKAGVAAAQQQALSTQSQQNNMEGTQNVQQGQVAMAGGAIGVVAGQSMIAKGIAMNMVPFVGTAPGAAMITAGKVTMGVGAAALAAGTVQMVSGNQQVNVAQGQATQAATQGGISQTSQSQASTHNSKADQLESEALISEISSEGGEEEVDDTDSIETGELITEDSEDVVFASAIPLDDEILELEEEDLLGTYLNEGDQFKTESMSILFGDERAEEISSEIITAQSENPDFQNLSTEEQVEFNVAFMEDKLINEWIPGDNSGDDFKLSDEDLTDMLFINENLSTEEFGALREDLENVFNEDSELTLNMSPEEKIDFSLNFYTDAVNAKEDTDY